MSDVSNEAFLAFQDGMEQCEVKLGDGRVGINTQLVRELVREQPLVAEKYVEIYCSKAAGQPILLQSALVVAVSHQAEFSDDRLPRFVMKRAEELGATEYIHRMERAKDLEESRAEAAERQAAKSWWQSHDRQDAACDGPMCMQRLRRGEGYLTAGRIVMLGDQKIHTGGELLCEDCFRQWKEDGWDKMPRPETNAPTAEPAESWQHLSSLRFPVFSDSERARTMFCHYLARSLHETFGPTGRAEFASLLCRQRVSAKGISFCVYELITHRARFGERAHDLYSRVTQALEDAPADRLQETVERLQTEYEEVWPLAGWSLSFSIAPTEQLQMTRFVYDSEQEHICIEQMRPEIEMPDGRLTLSDVYALIHSYVNGMPVCIDGIDRLQRQPAAMGFMLDLMDRRPLNLGRFRVKAGNDEEWDYLESDDPDS